MVRCSWLSLLHPEFAERSKHILLSSAAETDRIEVEQVYLCKDGGLVHAVDSHSIFFNRSHIPALDYVEVSIQQTMPAPSYNSRGAEPPPQSSPQPAADSMNVSEEENPWLDISPDELELNSDLIL